MELNYLKTVCLEKRILINYINIIEIIIIVIITQLYLPQFQFLDLKGGSGEVIEYPTMLGIVNYSLSMNDYPENMDRLIEMPEFETDLRPMGKLNRNNHILYPEDASSYIIPENEVVTWYAENTVLTDDALLWKHNGSAVEFKYQTDNALFDNPPDGDMWQNPDYYLANGATGDCEDFSLAFASILEAKGISAEVVGVTLINDRLHWVVRYYFNDQINYADINRNNVIIWHNSNPTIDEEWVIIDIDGVHPIK
jgi:hypothetical protein